MIIKVTKIKAQSSLGEKAYQTIKESLMGSDPARISGEDRIDERELARKLGISRTPLRESINRLAVEGFLRIVPRKGIYVVRKSKEEIIEILLVRAALEGMAARLATRYVTQKEIEKMEGMFSSFNDAISKSEFVRYSDANIDFHELVLKTSRCGKLIELAGRLFDHIRWIRFHSVALENRFHQMQKEHLAIIEALQNKDPDLSETRMRAHIEGLAGYIQEKADLSF